MQKEHKLLKANIKEARQHVTSIYETKIGAQLLKKILGTMKNCIIGPYSKLGNMRNLFEYWEEVPNGIDEAIASCYIKYKTKVEVKMLQSILTEMKTKLLSLVNYIHPTPIEDNNEWYYESEYECDSESDENFLYGCPSSVLATWSPLAFERLKEE